LLAIVNIFFGLFHSLSNIQNLAKERLGCMMFSFSDFSLDIDPLRVNLLSILQYIL